LALVAPDLVPAVLGDQWTAAIAPLRILAVFAGARSLAALPQIVLVARGHAREARNFSIVAAVVLPISFLIGSRWGMTGIATAWLIGLPLCVIPLDFRYSMKLVGLSARPVVSALGPAVAGCAVMAISVLLVKQALPADAGHVVALLVSSLTGAAAYTGYILVAHRDRVRAFRATFRGARRAADVSSSHVAAQPAATPPIAAGVSTCAE
jgi:PST family polysaccharide transporter